MCAGEPINPEVMQKWKEATGLHIYEGYGQTETVRKYQILLYVALRCSAASTVTQQGSRVSFATDLDSPTACAHALSAKPNKS